MHWIPKNKWILPDEFNHDYTDMPCIDSEYYSAELHVANMTQRWLINNFTPDRSKTSKQQIMDYLDKFHSKLPIATKKE